MNPYRYGYPVEVGVPADGIATASKHFAMGRLATELSYAMPDQRTVYITDDGTNTMLTLFLADAEGSLDAGTLYGAKWVQLPGNEAIGGRARLQWVNLGHANSSEIEAAVLGQAPFSQPVTFDDIFEVGTANPDGTCTDSSFTSVNAGHGGAHHECLKLKDIDGDNDIDAEDEKIASRLETRRWAAMNGVTTEFRKMEGFSYNPERSVAYLVLSEISKGMEDDTGSDLGGPNDIKVPANKCGGVYELRMSRRASVRDTDGGLIDSPYVAILMNGMLVGEPVSSGDTDTDGKSTNTCQLNGLANPDNATYLPRYNTLIIGEDTGSGHQNDIVWSYDLRSRELTRVLTTPYGSETTSPYWYPNINGWGYLMAVIQHPYGESDKNAPHDPEDERGYVGYFKFPALQ